MAPIGLKTAMPIVLDRELTHLTPAIFWCGGGAPDLKLRVSTSEFISCLNPVIGCISE